MQAIDLKILIEHYIPRLLPSNQFIDTRMLKSNFRASNHPDTIAAATKKQIE